MRGLLSTELSKRFTLHRIPLSPRLTYSKAPTPRRSTPRCLPRDLLHSETPTQDADSEMPTVRRSTLSSMSREGPYLKTPSSWLAAKTQGDPCLGDADHLDGQGRGEGQQRVGVPVTFFASSAVAESTTMRLPRPWRRSRTMSSRGTKTLSLQPDVHTPRVPPAQGRQSPTGTGLRPGTRLRRGPRLCPGACGRTETETSPRDLQLGPGAQAFEARQENPWGEVPSGGELITVTL